MTLAHVRAASWPAVIPAVLAVAGVMLATACGAPPGVAAVPRHPQAAPSVNHGAAAASRPVAPLTGQPATSARAAARPAVALDLTGNQPRGLNLADVVFEEITTPIRYIAVFQSRQAVSAGPIGDTRPDDGMVLSVLRARIGYDSGTAGFLDVLHLTKVTDLGYAAHPALYRQAGSGLTASTAAFDRAAPGAAPPQLLNYRGEGPLYSHVLATAGVQRRSRVLVRLPGAPVSRWRFDPASDRWEQTAGGPRVSAANLIVQTVGYKQVFLSHREGLTVPSARVVGTGRAEVFTGLAGTKATGRLGLAVRGTWSKRTLGDVTNYLATDHSLLSLAPGPTWIILAPPATTVTTGPAAS